MNVIDFRNPPAHPFMFAKPYGPPRAWPEDRAATFVPLAYGRAGAAPYQLRSDSTLMIAPRGQTAQAERKVLGTYGGAPVLDTIAADRTGLGEWTEADQDALLKASDQKRAGDTSEDLDRRITELRRKRTQHYGSASKSWFHDLPTGAQVALVAVGGAIVIRILGIFKS